MINFSSRYLPFVYLLADSTGRVFASMTSANDRTALIVSEVPVRHRRTLYSIIGDTFGLLCGLLFLFVIVVASRKSTPNSTTEKTYRIS